MRTTAYQFRVYCLSPRVRGNRLAAECHAAHNGSIPARAGEPRRVAPVQTWQRVYPRACGGTTLENEQLYRGDGLSPRVRGNQRPAYQRLRNGGSIPARAGEPRRRGLSTGVVPVYPRACGGTIAFDPDTRVLTGLFPARAGEPQGQVESLPVAGVYPRACGGTGVPVLQSNTAMGLSPRVRGNLADPAVAMRTIRSIPARAGEPRPPTRRCLYATVYPRACGGTVCYLS